MSKILVFGHQNPDSDAIGSSVAFAYLAKEAYGLDTEAVALGTPNEETAFVLDYFGVEAPGLMLSGLISDTLLLKSPTTHPSDKVIAPELAELAGVNLEEYGLAMLKAGTNLASKSAEELIDIDAKTFELNGNNVRVAQVNTVDIAEVLERQAEIEAAIQAANVANGYSDFVLMITDIVNSNSEILALGANMDKVEAAFDFKLENNHAFLPGAVSRKRPSRHQLATIAMWPSFWTIPFIMQRWKVASLPNLLKISLKLRKSMTFITIRKSITKKSKSRQKAFWVRPTILPFIRMEMVITVPSSLLNYSLFLRPFP